MLTKIRGFPEEDDIVLCTVTKVQRHGVFARLDEFENASGLIHISEIAPGRIRNIREFVAEGKVVVCKVLRVDKKSGHIDLSLRRVNETVRRNKLEQIKQRGKAEKIIEGVAELTGRKPAELYAQVMDALEGYSSLYDAFLDVSEGSLDLSTLGLDPKVGTTLQSLVLERVKPPEVTIEGRILIKSYDPAGVEDVKSILAEIEAIDDVSVSYAGGGGYRFSISAPDYKGAESTYERIETLVVAKKNRDREIEIERKKR